MKNKNYNIGLIGCGDIAAQYLDTIKHIPNLNVTAVATRHPSSIEKKARHHSIPKVCSVNELLADKNIDIILNLTTPDAHYDLALAALKAGKHVYNEKPLAFTRDQCKKLLQAADKKNLRIGCAPDTFLGPAIQTSRRIIDTNGIGTPLHAALFMQSPGVEHWHPNPEFYYKPGGGPLFDMGPYYLTALVYLLGPVKSVFGSASTNIPQRTITSKPKYGKKIRVEVPTHVLAVLTLKSGVICSLAMSFEVRASRHSGIEVHGTDATLFIKDPNYFDTAVSITQGHYDANQQYIWTAQTLDFELPHIQRGFGLAQMTRAMDNKKEHLTNGKLAAHVVDIMQTIHESARHNKPLPVKSSVTQPPLLDKKLISYLKR
ncbi:MAG: Gfo/Idh/MocA family oxidoreductase [Phycisphaerae bacterium]|jgi:predicted dehydrogenase